MRCLKLIPFSLVALASCAPLALASDLTLRPEPTSKGCPVELSVLEQAPGRVLPVSPSGRGEDHVIVRLRSVGGKALQRAEISIFGDPSHGLMPASTEGRPVRVKKVEVWWRDRDGSLGADVALDWFGVRSVRVDAIEYAEAGRWTPSKEQYCVAAPRGTMLVGELR